MDSYTQNTKPHKPNSGASRHEASSPTDLFSSAQVIANAAMSTFKHEPNKVNKSEAAAAADSLLHAASQYGHLEEKGFGKYIEKADQYLHQYAAPSSRPPSHGSGPTQKYQEEEEYEEEHYTGHKQSAQPPSYGSGKVKKHQEEEYEDEEYPSHKPSARPPSYGGGKVTKHQEEEYEEEEEYPSHKPSGRPNSYAGGKTKKHQDEEEEGEGSGGGMGDYMKLAQGFLKSQGGAHSAGGNSEGAGIGDYMKLAQGFLGKR
ncbi:hypothetical protein LUZ62_047603 [Rhynchospora pubera]|uniref:Uncharacterized protein n=1 Tax=Rhynchospora pubera TaxID=906938 RepID=A0AAV8C858_9POAL|nr:hypothetical protein LUZ62_085107 [Rhynchospora pubera]KAJ4796357.1 hypothetical protein LUZ62_047603 [Rhynchospora pubera]